MSRAHRFLQLALDCGALQFGRFRLKSGRLSPYFFNASALHTGRALYQTGMFYAQAVSVAGIGFDGILGLAYKGIPIAVAMAMCLERSFGMNVRFSANRKHLKDHGEGGHIVGAPLHGRLVLVDDVITAGTAVHEAMRFMAPADAHAVAIVVAFDRAEKSARGLSTPQEIEARYGLRVVSIANANDLIEQIKDDPQYAEHMHALHRYRAQYAA